MPRKAKKYVHPMPPLGLRDQILYWCAMLLTGVGSLVLLFSSLDHCERVALSDERVVAYFNNHAGFMWLVIWLWIVCLLIALWPYRSRYPIFGNSRIKYGPPAWPRVYPLLMKEKPKHWVSQRDMNRKKWKHSIIAAVLLVTLIPGLILSPRSAYPRTVLLRDGTVAKYDAQNREEHFNFSQITQVEVKVYRVNRRRGLDKKSVKLVIHTEETSFSFTAFEFAGDWEESLRQMIKMKSLYGPLVMVEQDPDLDRVIRDYNLSKAEQALLYQLFS